MSLTAHDQLRKMNKREIKCRPSVARGQDLVALHFEGLHDLSAQKRIILNDQDFPRGFHGWLHPGRTGRR